MRVAIYVCSRCKEEITPPDIKSGGVGYGVAVNGDKHCYQCCADLDREYMVYHGKTALYLTTVGNPAYVPGMGTSSGAYVSYVSNWCGTLRFLLRGRLKRGRHNIAGVRYDFYFNGPDSHIWHGVQYGDNTMIARCKSTRARWRK